MRRIFVGVVFMCATLWGGCIRCPVGTTRCDGNAAIACLSNSTWTRYRDCDEVAGRADGGAWVCCNVQQDAGAVAACVPASECH